jgi:hypothetical protein
MITATTMKTTKATTTTTKQQQQQQCENRWLSFEDKHREGFKGWLIMVA